MTILENIERQCTVCGQPSTHVEMIPRYPVSVPMGALNLDLRPPETNTTLLALKVQQCPHCGYASHFIEGNREDNVVDIVWSAQYQALFNQTRNDLLNAFVCQSYLSEQAGDFAGAGWQALRAAWAAEDANDMDTAAGYRCRAVELLLTAREKKQPFGDADGELLLLIELYRRIGQLALAEHFCGEILHRSSNRVVKEIADYQLTLIAARDTDAHSIGEALNQTTSYRACGGMRH